MAAARVAAVSCVRRSGFASATTLTVSRNAWRRNSRRSSASSSSFFLSRRCWVLLSSSSLRKPTRSVLCLHPVGNGEAGKNMHSKHVISLVVSVPLRQGAGSEMISCGKRQCAWGDRRIDAGRAALKGRCWRMEGVASVGASSWLTSRVCSWQMHISQPENLFAYWKPGTESHQAISRNDNAQHKKSTAHRDEDIHSGLRLLLGQCSLCSFLCPGGLGF